jgi:Ni,Fe-hydrogenase maturation factor
MPHDVVVFAVQTHDVDHVTGKMSRAVKAAVPEVVKMIMAEITG